ncbi:MAG: MlaE family ABC transporter permease [Candidatus Eiseniibacteriota bacterium]
MLGLLNGLLSGFARFLMGLQDLALFSGRVIVRCFRPPFYFRDTYEQAYHSGVGSLHLALISAFFAGQALGLQFSRQLAETGSTTLLGMLMTISVVRALGPDLIGLVVAARLASGFTAEIGAMKSANQIDALVAFGTDPIRKLAVPRFVALLFMLPMLVILGDMIAIIGGAIMAHFVAHISLNLYWQQVQHNLTYGTILIGLVKPAVFAALIALIGCWKGFTSSGGARGVGRSTTESVTIASVMILIGDFILTRVLFAILRW